MNKAINLIELTKQFFEVAGRNQDAFFWTKDICGDKECVCSIGFVKKLVEEADADASISAGTYIVFLLSAKKNDTTDDFHGLFHHKFKEGEPIDMKEYNMMIDEFKNWDVLDDFIIDINTAIVKET